MQQSFYNLKEEHSLSEVDSIALQSELNDSKRDQLLAGALFVVEDDIFFLWTWFPIQDLHKTKRAGGVILSPYPLSSFSTRIGCE